MYEKLYLSGLLIALFFVLLICAQKGKTLKDYFLALYIFLLGTNLFILHGMPGDTLFMQGLLSILDFLYWVLLGPVLYIYTQLLISGRRRLIWADLWTSIPLLLCLVGFSPELILEPATFLSSYEPVGIFSHFCVAVWLYNSPLFFLLSFYLIRKHQKRIKHYFSYTEQVDLKWLYYLTIGFAVYLISILAPGLLMQLLGITVSLPIFRYSWLVLIVYIFMIGFFGIRQKRIFSGQVDEQVPASLHRTESSSPGLSYSKSGLCDEESRQIMTRLIRTMEMEKPYLSPDLDLATLARHLNVSTHKLSQTINERGGKNFYDFINGYRHQAVKERLDSFDLNRYNITLLAFECGFNSKSSFYQVFKKVEKITPSQYLRQVKTRAS